MGLSCFKSWKQDRTRHKGNRDVLASPGSYFFLSNSAGQGDEWLKTLNKGVWIPFTGVFGQRLEETVLYERRYGVRLVPLVVEQCVNFIRERGLHEVGLFRRPGQARTVQELQQAFDTGERPKFDSSTDVHTVASLLKLYLRQLPEPLVPYSHYQDFLLCGRKLSSDRTRGLAELRNLLHELPVVNFNLLNFICQFLNEVQSFSSSNKMSCQNLATVFGPNIFRAKAEDPQSIVGGAAMVQVLMFELINEYQLLFSKVPPPSLGGRGPYGGSPGQMHGAPCLRQLSLPLIAQKDSEAGHSCFSKSELSSSQKTHLGHRYTSSHPETCLFLPQRSSSPRHNVNGHYQTEESKLEVLNWTEAWPDLREPNADYWTPDAAKEGLEFDSGGSSEPNEDSTPSAYDNIEKESLEDVNTGSFENVPAENIEDKKDFEGQTVASSSSWSSCEILPLDESVSPAHSPKRHTSLPSMELVNSENIENDNDEVYDRLHFTTPTSRSEPSDSPLSTGSSEVFLPSGPPELQDEGEAQTTEPKDPQTLLVELQQQMAQQRAEYQARIHRLERCNDVLERQITILRLSLEQQKRSQSVAEVKIRNMERAKADADQRNSRLQRDMDLFFQMYGQFRKQEDTDEDDKPGGRMRDRVLQSL